MATAVEEKRHELAELRKSTDDRLAKLEEDGYTPAEDWLAETEAMVNAVEDRSAEVDRLEKLAKAGAGRGGPKVSGNVPHPKAEEFSQKIDMRSLGERFLASDEWRQWADNSLVDGGKGNVLRAGKRADSAPMSVNGTNGLIDMRSALFTGASDTSGGAFITADRTPIYNQLGRRPLDVLDIIRVLQTGSDLVEFVKQTSRTNAAAAVVEATATSGGSGVKPESDAAFEVVQAAVQTLANWMAATRQAVADAPQLRGIIDTELRDNLRELVEAEVVAGNGTPGFTGIFETTGTQTQAWDTNILTTTRKARTLVRTVGRTNPTAYVLSPTDWQTIDLLQDNEARYYYGGPASLGTPRLWGLPVVESESVISGYGLVGDFTKAVLWDRMQAAISISDSHSDFFIRNLIAILAEMRSAFGVIQPNAFVEIDTAA